MLRDGLNDAFSDEHSGWHTEDLAEKFRIGREAQDEWALRSQQRFSTAQAAGKFKEEIVPLELPGRKGATIFDKDEHNRPQTTLEALAVNPILTALLSAESLVPKPPFLADVKQGPCRTDGPTPFRNTSRQCRRYWCGTCRTT
jgi:hypothetical protein